MDSGNSGSISSSGDEEYDSRPSHYHNQPIQSFQNQTTHFGSNSNPNNNPQHTHTHQLLLSHHHNNIFDHHNTTLSSSSDPNTNNNSNNNNNNNSFFLNLDTARSALMRSDHHHQPPPPPPYSLLGASIPNHHSLVLPSHHHHNHFPSSSPIQSQQLPSETVMTTSTSTTTTTAAAAAAAGSSGQPTPVRASKKRTRASRRAPTTVLTTDTTNFRAMVQEFTGIPAPPFSATSPFSRRFDLFGGIGRSALEGPLYPNLVRPSAVKHQTASPFGNAAASYGSQQASDQHGLMRINNMANVMQQQSQSLNMAFQLQSLPSLHPDAPSSGVAQANLGLDQPLNVGLGYRTASNRVGSDASQNVWRADGAAADIGCKMNYTAAAAAGTSTAEFLSEKGGLEINVVSSRGTEGTVDSWVFPSD